MAGRDATPVYAAGIDLGTTYSCLSYLTPQGQPVACPNEEGEMTTPSVVLFDGDEIVVGSEALRNAVAQPERVVQHAKRYMGDSHKCWVVDGQVYTPVDISALIIRKLLSGAEARLGARLRHAVITVPAQFSDFQRQRTIEAGHKAGLERVDIINEPVAASLCYVLGEGMWFAELANDQTVMVFDLGGGTFDLSLVRYNKQQVTVVASGGNLNLGGIDWNAALEKWACEQFLQETPGEDPRLDLHTMQALANDVEQAKRALSVRPRATVTVQHAGRRKSFGVARESFEKLTQGLVDKARDVTEQLLRAHKVEIEGRASNSKHAGWAHVNAVLVTGGASRMPMIRDMLQRISGTTLNTTLSPDQSIAHGAAYYSGMLLSGQKLSASVLNKQATARLAKFKQQSITARALGIVVRDKSTGQRLAHYLIPANTSLPVAARQSFGTVTPDQRRVSLHIVESGASPDDPYLDIGECVVDELPPELPEATPIEVTIRYDEQARVHVSAREPRSGRNAKTTITRTENLKHLPAQPSSDISPLDTPVLTAARKGSPIPVALPPLPPPAPPQPKSQRPAAATPARPVNPGARQRLEEADRPIPLCNSCGEPFDARGRCPGCGTTLNSSTPPRATSRKPVIKPTPPKGMPAVKSSKPRQLPESLGDPDTVKLPPPKSKKPGSRGSTKDDGGDDFWNSLT
ncbi:Chaperone protein DnaK [Caulifigura coniformis]|uniref:Chaperone protein DnaK n=1 Tax=Caulifigura coniformis TaxID=2527983 RepID=A0A517SDF1_9PLAN|nr:Hsp70 family protein [Caulifigura coniformis]QDT54137.1 Chaperone protein DnaK [Caulifigura coniformis]